MRADGGAVHIRAMTTSPESRAALSKLSVGFALVGVMFIVLAVFTYADGSESYQYLLKNIIIACLSFAAVIGFCNALGSAAVAPSGGRDSDEPAGSALHARAESKPVRADGGAAHMGAMTISPETRAAARDLLGHYDLTGGTRPGSFRAGLFDLWVKADPKNSAALAVAFPDIAPAVALRRNTEALTELAHGQLADPDLRN